VNQTVHIAVNAPDQKPIWLNDLLTTFDNLSILALSMMLSVLPERLASPARRVRE